MVVGRVAAVVVVMSTSPIWSVHCDMSRPLVLEISPNGMSRAVNPCHAWIGEESSAAEARAAAKAALWTVVSRHEAYCPPCAEIRKATS